ncbi:MAG TPA: hypothetical protein VF011_02765 [Terriglobales bacterium]
MDTVKGYFQNSRDSQRDETKVEIFLSARVNKAMHFDTWQLAQNQAAVLGNIRVSIEDAEGYEHICRDFRVEERAPGDFVVCCLAPFALQADGEIAPRQNHLTGYDMYVDQP